MSSGDTWVLESSAPALSETHHTFIPTSILKGFYSSSKSKILYLWTPCRNFCARWIGDLPYFWPYLKPVALNDHFLQFLVFFAHPLYFHHSIWTLRLTWVSTLEFTIIRDAFTKNFICNWVGVLIRLSSPRKYKDELRLLMTSFGRLLYDFLVVLCSVIMSLCYALWNNVTKKNVKFVWNILC